MDEYHLRIVILKLEDEGIQTSVFDQRDSTYNAFGYIYLKVRMEDEMKAQELLNHE